MNCGIMSNDLLLWSEAMTCTRLSYTQHRIIPANAPVQKSNMETVALYQCQIYIASGSGANLHGC